VDGDVVALWMGFWWLSGWDCGGSVDGIVVAQWSGMWWLSGWGCGGSVDGDVVAQWLRPLQTAPDCECVPGSDPASLTVS
jgi:hypothetical protein